MYDQNGKSTGTAVVHFTRVGDAAVAFSKFNAVPLDGNLFDDKDLLRSQARSKKKKKMTGDLTHSSLHHHFL